MNVVSVILYKFAINYTLYLAYEKVFTMDWDCRRITVHTIYTTMHFDIHSSYPELSGEYGYPLCFRGHRNANFHRTDFALLPLRPGSQPYGCSRQAGHNSECRTADCQGTAHAAPTEESRAGRTATYQGFGQYSKPD